MRNFISVHDVNDIDALVQKAIDYKSDPFKDKALGVNKRVGLLFLNPSMRTRLSTQIAASNLGMDVIVFNIDKDGWRLEFEEGAIMSGNTVEHIKDAAPIMGSYFDILCIRTFPSLVNKHEDYSELFINQFIKYAGIPVVSLESATLHPLQSFTDIITIREVFKEQRKPKIVLTWAPHIKPIPQCVGNSFAEWINAWGNAEFVITHPEDYELDVQFTKGATIEYDQEKALQGADFVYVKNWSSYIDYGKVLSNDSAWMLTMEHLQATNNAKVMHCLPVRRNVELSDEILDSANSIVSLQAKNRVWAAQVVLAEILRKSN
jgi:N-succinyl-L-ornithine transcarbamylase